MGGLKVHLEGQGRQVTRGTQSIVDRLVWSSEGKAASVGAGPAAAVDYNQLLPNLTETIEEMEQDVIDLPANAGSRWNDLLVRYLSPNLELREEDLVAEVKSLWDERDYIWNNKEA